MIARLPIDLRTTVAFTGHRSYRGEAGNALLHALESLYARGFRTFLSGMAAGFDLAAADAVLVLRRRCPDVRLVSVIPFYGQERSFTPAEQQHYRNVLGAADGSFVLARAYYPGCFRVRNDWLVAHAALLVSWYDGSAGGTHYTVGRAVRAGRMLLHLHPKTPAAAVRDPELFG